MRCDDVGQRVDRQLVALAGAEQAEAQDDLAILDAQGRLHRGAIDEWKLGDAVRNDMQAPAVDPVHVGQASGRGLRHDDRGVGQGDQLGEDGPLTGRRALQDSVERRDGRDIEGPDEVDDVSAVLASPDPVLVLDRDDADAPAAPQQSRM